MRKRILLAALTATIVFGSVVGLAASLTVSGGQLGSGTASVSSCDTDGVTTTYTYNGSGGISAVVVSGLADGSATQGSGACDSETVYVEMLDSSSNLVAANTKGSAVNSGDAVDTAADSVTVTLTAAATAASVANVRVTVTG